MDPLRPDHNTSLQGADSGFKCLDAYALFLDKHASLDHIRIEFWTILRADKQHEGLGLPDGLIALSPRVRWMLRKHLHYPIDSDHWLHKEAIQEGPLVLFRAVAYAEFWQHHGLTWWFRYNFRKANWRMMAAGRAQQLLEQWFEWRRKHFDRKVPQ